MYNDWFVFKCFQNRFNFVERVSNDECICHCQFHYDDIHVAGFQKRRFSRELRDFCQCQRLFDQFFCIFLCEHFILIWCLFVNLKFDVRFWNDFVICDIYAFCYVEFFRIFDKMNEFVFLRNEYEIVMFRSFFAFFVQFFKRFTIFSILMLYAKILTSFTNFITFVLKFNFSHIFNKSAL